ncbi:MBL fold metallo-hydrolase [Rhodococcus opacus]|uniref:MBL fold metallo-hydrolase n=1 Tax=Rhodococcus opacus TaxID=37919 RepID=UPI0027E18563|nr:MBL fold metallo-hydrolase [Rhodococcus opacus]
MSIADPAAARKAGVTATAFARGVWGTTLPFPSPLAYSFGYLVAVDRGVIAVDLGWNSDESWEAFQLGLERAGAGLDSLLGVLVTHVHPDHYGLADRVQKHTDAWIAMHPGELPHVVRDEATIRARVEDMTVWLTRCGVPVHVLDEIHSEEAELTSGFASVSPDILLGDGDKVPGTGGTLVALHTPGHTPGHLCFHDTERNLVFTGDHVLPRVTPNVSRRPGYGDDPLSDYSRSLERLRVASDALVLPGHEWAFDALEPRLQFLQEHQDERAREVEAVVVSGATTVWEVTQALKWARPFEQLASRGRRQAIGETHAHLYRLRNERRLAVDGEICERWSRAADGLSRRETA